MAYQRVALKRIIRQRCDLENTTFETETELDDLINDAAAQLHDLLISCAGANYSVSTGTITTTAGIADYQISATNFYRPIRVSVQIDTEDYPLSRFEKEGVVGTDASNSWGPGLLPEYNLYLASDNTWHISFLPAPDSAQTVNLTYHTAPPTYSNDTDDILIPYADYIVVEAAIRIKDKEDRDTSRLERERAAIQKRIEDWGATFDRGQPFRTIDIYKRYRTWGREF